MPRFTISHHTGAKEEDHYDLFLEQGELLKTWRLQNTVFQAAQTVVAAKDHRPMYLDHEGEVSGKRGQVRIWDRGTYTSDLWTDARIQVALQGRQFRGRLLLERDEKGWSLVDAAVGLRRSAGALLRGDPLDPAPTPELESLREALAVEERRLMAQVDLFTRGSVVHWAQAALHPELLQRVDAERARWQHPWLASARAYAARLGELASVLAGHRPPEKP